MSAKKVIGIIVSSVLVLALGFCITWTVINFDAIKYAMSGTALYTKEDLEAAYQDGYNSAGLDHKDLQDIIADLRADLDAETAKYNTANANYLEYVAKYGEASEEAKTAKAQVQELEKEVSNLETTIKSYEAFKEAVEAENKVTATFEYDGAIILLQSYDKGSTITGVTVPDDTDEIQFNGWTVNSEAVDLSTYTISENTTFVADLTYYTYYTVTFKVDDTEYDSQRVLSGSAITLHENPTKDGYEFKGWSIDGTTVIEVPIDNVSASTTYIAVFEKTVSYFTSLEIVENDDMEKYARSWTDGENVYYSYDEEQYVLNKGTDTWEVKTWYGLTDFSYKYIWTDGYNIYYSYDEEQYVLNKETSTWEEKIWSGLSDFSRDDIWTDGENIYAIVSQYSSEGSVVYVHYTLNKDTSTWVEKKWADSSLFVSNSDYVSADYIWTDGENMYYSSAGEHYVLNKETDTWKEKTWYDNPGFMGNDIWTDGEYCYIAKGSSHYVLNKETDTWKEIIFSGLSITPNFTSVFTDGTYYYCKCSYFPAGSLYTSFLLCKFV